MKATKVNVGLTESNGRLMGIWRNSLHVTCGLTACTPGSAPGPTLGNEYGKTLPLPVRTTPSSPSFYRHLVPCTLDNVGTILWCYQTSNMILTNATTLLVHFFIMSKFYVIVFCVSVYLLSELFFIHNVGRLFFCVNMCACNAYFTITLLTYLHRRPGCTTSQA